MNRKAIVLAGCLATALPGFAEPAIKDRSVIGRWTFDGADEAEQKNSDISGFNGSVSSWDSGVSLQTSGGVNDSGCANIDTLGKKITFTLGKDENGVNVAQSSTFYSWAFRVKTSSKMADLPEEQSWLIDRQTANFGKCLNNHDEWHGIGMRVQTAGGTDMNPDSSYTHAYFCDLTTTGDDRAEIATDGTSKFPMSVSGSSVTVGGSVSGKSFGGLIDDVMIINRMLSKNEFIRLYKTGETYIYPTGDSPSFASSSGWSSAEGNTYAPGGWPGAAYVVDGGKLLKQGSSATFGGDVNKKVSLTLGRLAPLTNMMTGGTLVSNLNGYFRIEGEGTAIVIYDLRLNKGKVRASGTSEQSLAVTYFDVEALSEAPFELQTDCNFSLNVSEATTGSGVLAKTGAGNLTVGSWSGTAKLRLSEGSVRTPRLDGYTGGTVLVTKGSTVAFTGTDALPTTENKMNVLFDGEKPTEKTAVMTVPNGVTAAMIQDVTQYGGGKSGLVKVENGVVSVEPVFSDDIGPVPVLMVE